MSSAESTPQSDPQTAVRHMSGLKAAEQPSLLDCAARLAQVPPSLTDRGNARLFVQLYREQVRHVEGLGWFAWDGCRWKRTGGDKAALWAAGEMAENLPDTDPNGVYSDRELAHHKKKTLSTTGMKALLAQAKAAPELSIDPDALDGDPYTLCTPAGVVDLRTGRLRAPDPLRDCHSRATTVIPRRTDTPRWNRFLADTFGEDAEGREMIDFLHLLLGYSITGDVGARSCPSFTVRAGTASPSCSTP